MNLDDDCPRFFARLSTHPLKVPAADLNGARSVRLGTLGPKIMAGGGEAMKFRPLHDRVVVRRIEKMKKPRAASSFPTPPRKSRNKARLSPLDRCS